MRQRISENTPGGRIFIFGIDSATFNVMLPLVEQGKMPATEKLMKEGAWCELLSTHPPLTPPAWTTFMTGRMPEHHGIFDFWRNEMSGPKYRRRYIGSEDIRCHTIFRILDFHGKKSLVVGMPMTYPPFKLNGALISGFMTPGVESDFTYPRKLKAKLLNRFGDYVFDPKPAEFDEKAEDEIIDGLIASDRSKVRGADLLMELHKDWDLLSVILSSVDHVQHHFWKYADPLHPGCNSDKTKIYSQTIDASYIRLDNYLKHFLEHLSPDDTVIVLSDHGAGPARVAFHIDTWLKRNGYLKTNFRVALKNRLKQTHRKVDAVVRDLLKLPAPRRKRLKDRIFYKRTRAFGGGRFEKGIYLNEKEKRPTGAVKPGAECEALRADLISLLERVRDPRSGEYVFKWIKPREEVYSGGFSWLAPDILFENNPGYEVVPGIQDSLFDYNTDMSGIHEPEGIFISSGPAIKKNHRFESSHIADVAPTILYLMGLPIDADMDGRLLENIVRDDYKSDRPPEFIKYSELLPLENKERSYTDDEEEVMKRKLESLGYM